MSFICMLSVSKGGSGMLAQQDSTGTTSIRVGQSHVRIEHCQCHEDGVRFGSSLERHTESTRL